jgi:flagellar hook-associated protein 2
VASSTSAIFTGSSAFSSSLTNAITQAVNAASGPITQLNNEKTTLSSQNDEVSTLNSKFSAVQSAVSGIGQALTSSFNTSVSDTSAVTATAGAGALPGTYTIQVNDIGAYSTMMTGTWTGSGTAQSYQLWIGGQEYSVNPADNSADSVAAAINSKFGNLVQATVVNVGSSSAPDDRISLQSTGLTSAALDLRTGTGTSLAATQAVGRPAQYVVDQSANVVSSSTRNVQVASGVTLSLLQDTTSPVTVTVTRNTSSLGNALATFASAYNAAVDELGAQRGQSGGALQGKSIVRELSQALESIATYSTNGAVGSLADLGLSLGSDGHFTVDSSQLTSASLNNPAAVTAFLGSASGGGFLQTATNVMNSIEDPTSGLLPREQTDLQNQIKTLTTQISDKQTQVNNLQTQLTTQMSAADASISTMEQQYNYVSGMFQAMQVAEQQYK